MNPNVTFSRNTLAGISIDFDIIHYREFPFQYIFLKTRSINKSFKSSREKHFHKASSRHLTSVLLSIPPPLSTATIFNGLPDISGRLNPAFPCST